MHKIIINYNSSMCLLEIDLLSCKAAVIYIYIISHFLQISIRPYIFLLNSDV